MYVGPALITVGSFYAQKIEKKSFLLKIFFFYERLLS